MVNPTNDVPNTYPTDILQEALIGIISPEKTGQPNDTNYQSMTPNHCSRTLESIKHDIQTLSSNLKGALEINGDRLQRMERFAQQSEERWLSFVSQLEKDNREIERTIANSSARIDANASNLTNIRGRVESLEFAPAMPAGLESRISFLEAENFELRQLVSGIRKENNTIGGDLRSDISFNQGFNDYSSPEQNCTSGETSSEQTIRRNELLNHTLDQFQEKPRMNRNNFSLLNTRPVEPWKKSLFERTDRRPTPDLRYGSSTNLTAHEDVQEGYHRNQVGDPPGILLTPLGVNIPNQPSVRTTDPFASLLINSELTNQALLRLLSQGNTSDGRRTNSNVARLYTKGLRRRYGRSDRMVQRICVDR